MRTSDGTIVLKDEVEARRQDPLATDPAGIPAALIECMCSWLGQRRLTRSTKAA